MKHVKHGKKLISLLLSVAVAMSMTLSTVMTPLAASSSVSDLRQKLQELQTEQEKVNQQLKDAQSNKADAEALKTQLEQQKALILSQISNLSEQIGSLDEEIVNKQGEIDRKQQEVDQKQAEYDQRWADFKDRMRAMQRLNDGGSIALLSSATNLYQLLTFATTLDQIVNKDEDTCQQLENEHADAGRRDAARRPGRRLRDAGGPAAPGHRRRPVPLRGDGARADRAARERRRDRVADRAARGRHAASAAPGALARRRDAPDARMQVEHRQMRGGKRVADAVAHAASRARGVVDDGTVARVE